MNALMNTMTVVGSKVQYGVAWCSTMVQHDDGHGCIAVTRYFNSLLVMGTIVME